MAEEKSKNHTAHKGAIPFGLEVVLFVLAIFIIWVLTGGTKKEVEEKPFIVPLNDPYAPGMKYGPEDITNKYNYQQNLGTEYGPVDR